MNAVHTHIIAAALLFSTVAAVRADLIVQKDGTVIEGKVLARNAQGMTIQPDGPATLPPIQLTPDKIDRVVVIDEHGAETAEASGISLPVKRPDPHWAVPQEPPAPPVTPAPAGPTYYVIPLHGVVGETFLADALEKSLADAEKRKPTVVVLDIDSPGGMVVEAEQMMKTLHKYNKTLRVVALVDQDLSAAAITSLSAKTIYMKSTGTIGAATAFNGSNPDMPQDIQEKMQSAWRAVARNSAEEGGHDPLLAEAMIDSSKELHLETIVGKKTIVEGPGPHTIVTKGKILTLTSHEAEDCGLTAGIADDLDELADELNLKGWKECPGLGTALAVFVPKRRETFLAKAQELEAALKDNLADARASAPSEEVVTQRIVTGGSPIVPAMPQRPAMGVPRGGPGGMGGARGPAGARGGAVAPAQPQRVVTQQVVTVSPEQRAQWKNHSLATVAALQKMEQNIQDEISLSLAFGQKGVAEQLKDPLSALAEVRARVYAERNKYSGDSAAPGSPIAGTPRGPSAPARPTPPARPAPAQPPTAGAPRIPSAGKLVITKALWGDLPNGPSTDVTEKVQAMVQGDTLRVEADNGPFGDPAPNITKNLRVEYTLDGVPAIKVIGERERLVLSAFPTEESPTVKSASGTVPPLDLKNAPLPAAFSGVVKPAVENQNYKVGPLLAGIFAHDEFQDITVDGGILIGLRCGLHGSGKNAVVSSVQPVYLTPKGVVVGQLHGDPKASPVVDLIARDGYAVGGATLGGNINLEGLSLRFIRIKDQGLDPNDGYDTQYIGNFWPPTMIDGSMSIVGIKGRTNAEGHLGLGFVFMPQPATKNAP